MRFQLQHDNVQFDIDAESQEDLVKILQSKGLDPDQVFISAVIPDEYLSFI